MADSSDQLTKILAALKAASQSSSGPVDIWDLGDLAKKQVPITPGSAGGLPGMNPTQRRRVFEANQTHENAVPQELATIGNTVDGAGFIQSLAQMAYTQPDQFRKIQQTLFQGGFYGPNKAPRDIRFGAWDEETKNAIILAIKGTLQLADSGVRTSFFNFIQDRADNAKKAGTDKPQVVNQFTDLATLRQNIQSAAQQSLGRDLTEDEIQPFYAAFHSQEVDANAAANDQTSSVVNVTRPDAGAEAQQFLDDNFQSAEHQQRGAQYLQALEQMIGQPAAVQ